LRRSLSDRGVSQDEAGDHHDEPIDHATGDLLLFVHKVVSVGMLGAGVGVVAVGAITARALARGELFVTRYPSTAGLP